MDLIFDYPNLPSIHPKKNKYYDLFNSYRKYILKISILFLLIKRINCSIRIFTIFVSIIVEIIKSKYYIVYINRYFILVMMPRPVSDVLVSTQTLYLDFGIHTSLHIAPAQTIEKFTWKSSELRVAKISIIRSCSRQ